MADVYEKPSASPYTDFSEYTGLLLGVIEDYLEIPLLWAEDDREEALALMRELKVFFMELPDMLMFPGMVTDCGLATAPAGWLECDGAAVSRATYARLFAAIGTAYGVGDGATTFNLPDFRGRTSIGAGTGAGLTARALAAQVGAETHVLTLAQTPAHVHNADTSTILAKANGTPGTSNRLLRGTDANTNSSVLNQLVFQTTSQGGGEAHENMQPSLVMRKVIKT